MLLTNHAQPRHDVVTQLVEVCLTDAPAPLAASRLVREPHSSAYEGGTVRFEVDLPPHAVAAVTLELAPEPSDGGAPT